MRYQEKLREGLPIELEVNEGDYPGKYKTKIEELKPDFITIGAPIHEGQFVPLREETSINVYFHDHISGYGFISRIIRRETEPIPVFAISYPEQIVRVQRREFFRVPVVKELQYQVIVREGLSETRKGYMRDLSGGGILFKTKTKICPDTMLLLTFKLKNEEVQVPAEVTRCVKDDKNNFLVSVEFIEISERQRDKIIAYVFAIQREMRRKGLD